MADRTSTSGTGSTPYGRLAVAFGVATLAMAIAAAIADTFPFDETLLDWVRDGLGGWYDPVGEFTNGFMHYAGTRVIWAATVLALFWQWRRVAAIQFFALLPIGLITSIIKHAVDRPRPGVSLGLAEHMDSLSFPSGHVSQATVVYGLWFFLAGELLPPRWVLPVRVAAIVAVAVTGLSRVWAGAHWPSDVVGAMALGLTVVFIVLAAGPWIGGRLRGAARPN